MAPPPVMRLPSSAVVIHPAKEPEPPRPSEFLELLLRYGALDQDGPLDLGLGDLGQSIMGCLTNQDIRRLSQTSRFLHEGLEPEIERRAKQHIEKRLGRPLSLDEWRRIDLRDCSDGAANSPATALLAAGRALAYAPHKTVSVTITEREIPNAYCEQFERFYYSPSGTLTFFSASKAAVCVPTRGIFEILPPQGWQLIVPSRNVRVTQGSLFDPRFTCLMRKSDTATLGILSQGAYDDAADVQEIPLEYRDGCKLHCSPSARFVVRADPTEAGVEVVLYDAETRSTIRHAVEMGDLYDVRVRDDGTVWVADDDIIQELKLEHLETAAPRLASSSERDFWHLPTDQANLIVKEVQDKEDIGG